MGKSIKIVLENGSVIETPINPDISTIRGVSSKDFIVFDEFHEIDENDTQ